MDWIDKLKNTVNQNIIFINPSVLEKYASDYTEDLVHMPEVVAKPNIIKMLFILWVVSPIQKPFPQIDTLI